jgi:uncharacterized SAM-binding protein YcdF (DUF218 family)
VARAAAVTRVVAVLGYSTRRGAGALHPICEERVAHAAGVARDADAVILSGWARHPRASSEAELMRAAWAGGDAEIVCDVDARSTAENVRNIVADARRLAADELVVVTSAWHRRRARLLLAAATRGSGLRVSVVSPHGPRPLRHVVREAAAVALLPLQLRRLRARRRAPRGV